MERNFSTTIELSALEADSIVKVPSDILSRAGFVSGDVVCFEVGKEKVVISRNSVPQKETLESLFENYKGLPFKANLVDLGDPVGEEKWVHEQYHE